MDNKVLATVNGVNITEEDVTRLIARYPQENRAYLNSPQGRNQLLSEMVSFELMYNKGKELNLENSEEYKAQLKAMEKDLLTQYTINKLFEGVQISPEDVRAHYENNKEAFVEPPMVSAKHILVDSEDKAKELYNDIKAEKLSFEEAAMQYSSCPSKEQGGSLGEFSRGMMVPEFENAAFSMSVGEISEPVKSQFGYHLIKLESKKEQTEKAFEEVQGQVAQQLIQEKRTQHFSNMIEELTEKYGVKYY